MSLIQRCSISGVSCKRGSNVPGSDKFHTIQYSFTLCNKSCEVLKCAGEWEVIHCAIEAVKWSLKQG